MTDAAALPPQPLDIAIVGMAGAYAGAADLRHYWQNILDKIDSVTDAPPGWSHDNYDPASTANDRIYTRRGGFLGKTVVVDPLAFGVLPSVAAGGDPDHLIALTYARDALVDAGLYDATKRSVTGVDPARAGVVLGRGTYGNRGMSSMIARGLFVDQMMAVARGLRPDLTAVELAELREHFVRQLPPYGPDMVGPLTPNVVAGMIANRLNLMGPSFIVDAACASTLIAVDAAVRELVSGRCDLMITGGVQSQTPAQLYIQFCQIKALSHGQLRPFQKGADGTLLGEGVGLLVLKRRADAERDGDRIYALIQGIGTSSDGRAKGFLAPRVEGQVLALRRAYASCGIAPDTLGYIEAHGTGTVVGDRCEIETLRRVFGDRGEPRIALGSVKSMIGHCLPAAASASMIKTALALHHKILPPMLCDEPDPSLDLAHSPFYINNETRPWIHGAETPRRAGVNAFGFGGANAHVVLEEYRLPRKHYVRVLQRPRPSELLALAADTPSALQQLVGHALAHLRAGATLAEVACASATHSAGALRLALVADKAQDAIKKLQQALDKFGRDGVTTAFKTRGGVYYGCGPAPGKLCFLYPGEGAQYPGMLADLCLQFPPVRAWFDFLERTGLKDGKAPRANLLFPPPTRLTNADRQRLEGRLYDMDVAAESVYCATLGVQALLDELGLEPDAMLGHSTGENTALTAAGVYRPRDADELAQVVQHLNGLYRQLAETGRIVDGELLTVGGLSAERRGQLLSLYSAEAQGEASNGIVVAMDNCPNQIVLFGPSEAVETLHETLSVEGAICAALPFGRAYHTQHFTPMAEAVQAYFETLDFGPGRCAVYSACHAGVFPQHPTAIRGLAAAQWNHPVRFTETLQKLYADGFRVFLELGPSANLTAFVTDTLREHKEVIAVSCDNRRRGGIAQLQRSLAQLFAAGV
ncbi:MAG TPA: beta-ketoacyl synthase N-terminal-like domain-containing protein, partial [Nevskiaceae bacterium]|nr:beta-ketoacyl synthase N-terminal-like domain-containing protein [Nevskiaceae bacterium]